MTLSSWSRAVLVAIAASLLSVATAHAQGYPSKPIRIILPFPPGSATDSIARLVGKDIADTLMVASNTQLAANPSLYKTLSYNPVTDFAPVARLSTQPTALLVRKDFPAKTLAEFVAYAKANPKKLSAGYGASSSQIATARLRTLSGIEVLDVPYKGI